MVRGFTTVASVSSTAIKFSGLTPSSLTTKIVATGTTVSSGTFTPYINNFTGGNVAGTIVGSSNPTNGQTLILTMNGTSMTFTFVSVIGATAGNVLIGATLTDTLTNLAGILNTPSTTNATQVALSGFNSALLVTCINAGAVAVTAVLINSGTNLWAQDGFTNGGGTITINGVSYTYSSGYFIYTKSLPVNSISGVSANDIVISTLVTTDLTSTFGSFQPDFCYTIDNQVYYGSYTSSLCYVSNSLLYYSFSLDTVPVKGSANVIVFDSPLNGITSRTGRPNISVGGNKWGIVNYTYSVITISGTQYNQRSTNVEYTPTSAGSGAYAHEFIDQVGDSIVYLSQDQQVRTFGSFNTSFTSNNYPSLSQEIYSELEQEVFSNDTYTGNLRAIGDYIYLTSPISGLTYLYQARQAVNANNQVIVERLWHAPMTWNLTRVDIQNNTVIGFSNSNPQIYQLWDTEIYYDEDPTGDTFAYTSTLKFAYDGEKRRQGLWSFDKVFTEGYINPETALSVTVKYNFNGTEDVLTQFVNSGDFPATYFTIDPSSIGDESFGDDSLGMGGDDSDSNLYKFKVINQFSLVNTFEWQVEYESTESGSQWEILAKGTNARVEDQQDATFIINKQ